MAYDYDVDILAALWTGAEELEEPYASFIAANPAITNEVEENRILSTIELLRSHIELLQSREEANVLHFAIARLIRHTAGGSNPWSDQAAITEAVGNVNNPQFPAGATLDLDYNGSTVSPVSGSGGDCQTVVSELNVALDMGGAGVAEITNISTAGGTASGLSGKYFTINSAGDATNYYVWYDWDGAPEQTSVGPVADVDGSLGGKYFTISSTLDATDYYVWMSHTGRAEVTLVTAVADSGGSLGGKYFTINSAGDTTNYYVWLDHAATIGFADAVNGSLLGATVTAAAAATYDFDVTIDGGGLQTLSITTVGGESYTAIAALMSAVVAGGTVAYLDAPVFGFRVSSSTPGGTSAATIAAGTAGSGGGDLFAALDAAETVTHTFPAGTTGIAAPTDPAPGGLTAITASYSVGDSASEVALAVSIALNGSADFGSEGGTTLTVTNAANGAATDAADVDTGFTIANSIQGLDAAVDPAPGGLTGIPVSYSIGSIASVVGSAIQSAVDANGDFNASGSTPVLIDTATKGGPTTNSADVDTGFTISTTREGEPASTDPAPGGLTAVTVSLADINPSDGEIGAATRGAIGALGDFSTEGLGTTCDVTNAAVGDTTDAADVDTGLSISVTTQGADAGGDVVPLTAFCAQPGNRIGIRSQQDQLSFSISNGGGGIVGPGGLIPGERESAAKRVSTQGRDAATNNVVGTLRKLGGL